MANLTPTESWDDVYQIATTDPNSGGPGGILNLAPQALLNRTEYLATLIDNKRGYDNLIPITSLSGTFDLYFGCAYLLNGISGSSRSLRLPAANGKPAGSTITVLCRANIKRADVPFVLSDSDALIIPESENGSGVLTDNYPLPDYGLIRDEVIQFVSDGFDKWYVTYYTRHLKPPVGSLIWQAGNAGDQDYLVCDGTSVAKADYPALFEVIGYNYGGSGANFNLPDSATDFGSTIASLWIKYN
jgi:hypothetical protein